MNTFITIGALIIAAALVVWWYFRRRQATAIIGGLSSGGGIAVAIVDSKSWLLNGPTDPLTFEEDLRGNFRQVKADEPELSGALSTLAGLQPFGTAHVIVLYDELVPVLGLESTITSRLAILLMLWLDQELPENLQERQKLYNRMAGQFKVFLQMKALTGRARDAIEICRDTYGMVGGTRPCLPEWMI